VPKASRPLGRKPLQPRGNRDQGKAIDDVEPFPNANNQESPGGHPAGEKNRWPSGTSHLAARLGF